MDPYAAPQLWVSNQNLKLEDERIPEMNKEEVIKSFKHFIRDYQIGNTFIYR
jgi:hypothetical protein